MRPQMYWMKGFDGRVKLDYIGKFEELAESFRYVCEAIGLGGVELPHELMGPCVNYRDHYDPESIKIVSNMERDVIRMFDYSF